MNSKVKLRHDIKAEMGRQLRSMYADVVNEGIPDRFSEIVGRLEQALPAESRPINNEKGSSGAPR
jgi:hypothetical protein